jgi:hypothetical protein
MQDDIVNYLRRSGLAHQSVEAVRPDLPRWERHLRSRGVTVIPHLPSRPWSPANSRAHNELTLLMMQAHRERDGSREHEHRNLTRIRPYKS